MHEMYPDSQVPPSPKVILPAPAVGLYVNNWPDVDPYTMEEDGTFGEVMFVCTPRLNDGSTTNFSITVLTRNIAHGRVEPFPNILGTIDSEKGEFGISPKSTRSEGIKEAEALRIVAAFLQTINNPRFVRRGKKTFSQMKKHSAKKVLRDFIAEQWNMVSWNVDKAVDAKNYEEGNGGRQGLHFRRGFFRRGESHWQNVQMIDGVWRQWIDGYEAGHPKYGVLKSYHVPRKDRIMMDDRVCLFYVADRLQDIVDMENTAEEFLRELNHNIGVNARWKRNNPEELISDLPPIDGKKRGRKDWLSKRDREQLEEWKQKNPKFNENNIPKTILRRLIWMHLRDDS